MAQATLNPELLARLRSGDPRARDEFLARYHPRIFSFGLMVCGHHEDAEDIAQDATLRALEAVTRLRSAEAFSVWLFRIVRHACLRQRRQQRIGGEAARPLARSGAETLPDPGLAAQPEAAAIHSQTRDLIRAALDELSAADRLLILLRDYEELPVGQIAQVLGLGESAVKMRLLRIRRRLRQRLQPQFSSFRQALQKS